MFQKKRVKVCRKCSGFDITELDGLVGKKNYSIGCIGACKKDRNMFYGKINGRIFESDTKEELFGHIKNEIG